MNVWIIYGLITVLALLVIAGIVVGAIALWRRQVRRALIALTGRREAIMASYRALEKVFTSLAEGTPEELAEFAVDPASVHRKALEELHSRMAIQSEELAGLPLPKGLWPAADLLAAAAAKLAKEVGRVGEAEAAEGVLKALGEIDVAGVRTTLTPMEAEIDAQLKAHKIDDPCVYGGGMYV